MSIESVMPSKQLILCLPLLLPPSIFPSIRVFSNESALCIRWPKYWSISFSTSHFNEYSRLISFGIDYLDLLAVQVTRRSLLQHHRSKASILQWSAFFTVQLSHPYMTTGKTIALTRQTFVGKVMSLITTQAPTKKKEERMVYCIKYLRSPEKDIQVCLSFKTTNDSNNDTKINFFISVSLDMLPWSWFHFPYVCKMTAAKIVINPLRFISNTKKQSLSQQMQKA